MANEVGRAKAIVELDFTKFERDIAKVRALLRSLKDEPTKIKIDADVENLTGEIQKIKRTVDKGVGKVEVEVDVDKEAQAKLDLEFARLKQKIRQFNKFRAEETRRTQGAEKERLRQLALDSSLLLNDISVKVDLDENDLVEAEAALALLVTRKREINIGVDANIAELAVNRAAAQVQLAAFKKALASEKLEIGESIRLANTSAAKNDLRLLAAEAKRILNDIPLDVDLDGIAAAEARLEALAREREVIVDIDGIAAAGAALAALEQQKVEVEVEVDLEAAAIKAQLAAFKKALAAEKLEIGESIRLANSAEVKNELRLLSAEARRILNDIPLNVDLDGIAAAEARLEALARRRTATVNVDTDTGGGGLGQLAGLLRIQQGLGPLALSGSLSGIGGSLGGLGAGGAAVAGIAAAAAAAVAALAGIAFAFGTVGSAAASAGVKITKFAIDAAAELEVPLKSLARITGDQFGEISAQVIDFARTTPFTVESAVKATQLAIAGIRIKPGEAVDFVSSIADAVAVGGGTTANFDNLTLALTKGAGRGKLQQREITQLVRNTRGLFRQDDLFANIAEDLGISQGDVAERAAAGALTFNESLGAIKRTLDEIPGAAGAAARATDTLAGAITNLEDNLQVASLGGFKGFLESAKDALTGDPENGIGGISDALANQFSIIGPAVGRAFDDIGPRIAPAINAIGPLIANTIDAIGPSLAALVDAIGTIATGFAVGFGQGEFGTVTRAIEGVGKAIAAVGVLGRPTFNIIIEGFKLVGNAAQILVGVITLPFTTLVKFAAEAGSSIIDIVANIIGALDEIPGIDLGRAEKFLNSASANINKIGDKVSQFSTGAIKSGLEGISGNFGEIGNQANIAVQNVLAFKTALIGNELGGTPVFDTEAIKASLSDFAVTEEAGSLAGQSYLNAMSNAIAGGADEISGDKLAAALEQTIADVTAAISVADVGVEGFSAELAKVGQTGEGAFATVEEAVNSYIKNIQNATRQQQVANLLAAAGFDAFATAFAKLPSEGIGPLIDQLAELGPAGIAAFEALIEPELAAQEGAKGVTEAVGEAKTAAATGIEFPVSSPNLPELEARLTDLQKDRAALVRVGADTTGISNQIDRLVAQINARRATLQVSVAYNSGEANRFRTVSEATKKLRHGGPLDAGQFSWVGEGGRELIYTGTTAASVINNQTSERIAGMLGLDAPRTFNAATIGATVSTSPQVTQASLGITNQQARIIGSTFAQTVGGVTAVIAPPYSDPEAIASKIRYNSKASQRP